MNTIQNIDIKRIHPHPDNPRKDLGDLTELAESIKVSGVLQNLTVVPDEPDNPDTLYTVVIGHRRLEGATLAGLSEVPCAVVEMTPAEQVKTMLMENMQRADLTVYEQAQGFQMMLDMGGTVESVAKDTGFSQATIRRRVKLLELDPKEFKKSEARGATLSDYLELEKIEDMGLKNKVLGHIGTANFRDELAKAIEKEALAKRMAKWEAAVAAFATKIDKRGEVDGASVEMGWEGQYNRWTPKDREVTVPDDASTAKYYYTAKDGEIVLYKERSSKPEEHQETEAERQRREKREATEAIKNELAQLTERYYSLRLEFIKEFGAAKKNAPRIAAFASWAFVYYEGGCADPSVLGELLDLTMDDDTEEDEVEKMVAEAAQKHPEATLLACAYASLDCESMGYWGWDWNVTAQAYHYHHDENSTLDRVYDFLISLGYEMSDEEKALRDGTHELFKKSKELLGITDAEDQDADKGDGDDE